MAIEFFLLGALSAIRSQSTIELDDKTELSTYAGSNDPSDHATVAINSTGDIFVVWHTEASDGFFVEGMLLHRDSNGNDEWSMYNQNTDYHIKLGKQDVTGVYSGNSDCQKPDVVAVGDNFIATWTRYDAADELVGRLESAFIEVTDGVIEAINFVSPGTYHSSGIGDVVDSTVSPGLAGVMPDLVMLAGDVAGVVYAHQDYISTNGAYREYDIRFAELDYSSGNFNATSHFHVDDQPLDNYGVDYQTSNWGTPMNGGNVTPDICLDADGNLVFAFSSFRAEEHNPNDTDLGRIWLYRYEPSGSSWAYKDSNYFEHSVNSEYAVRRPNLAGSELDFDAGDNEILLCWVDTESTNPNSPYRVRGAMVDYPSSGNPSITALNGPVEDEAQCVPLNLKNGTSDYGEDAIYYDQVNGADRTIYKRILRTG
jgi:hypothetical protein